MGCEGHELYLREHGLALGSEGHSLGVRGTCPLALSLLVLPSPFFPSPWMLSLEMMGNRVGAWFLPSCEGSHGVEEGSYFKSGLLRSLGYFWGCQ